MSLIHEAKTRSEHKPTLDRDGFEVRIWPLGIKPQVEDGLALDYIGPTPMSDSASKTMYHSFLVRDPKRIGRVKVTAPDRESKEAVSALLTADGYTLFTPDFDIHILAVRPKHRLPEQPPSA